MLATHLVQNIKGGKNPLFHSGLLSEICRFSVARVAAGSVSEDKVQQKIAQDVFPLLAPTCREAKVQNKVSVV